MAQPNIVAVMNMLKSQPRECPACRGRGYDDSSGTQLGGIRGPRSRTNTIPNCPLCRGGRVVYLDKTCCCGYAAVCYNQIKMFWWCGRDMCLAAKTHPTVNAEYFGAL